MMLNSFLLQLTLQPTIKSFLEKIETEDLQTWPQFLSQNILTTYYFFVGYFIQLTFLSVGFWLLDIPHQIAKGIAQITHNAR